ncbi:VOC family protein [Erwinia sp. CGal63]|uniref:VOC family protein n=1 Tax=Erwinia sp. CGal63 TaxID=2919889 RepID=UPI00300B23DC
MLTADMTLLFVTNPMKSMDFYSDLFQAECKEAWPTFCQLTLPGGFKLGLWSKYTAEPLPFPAQGSAGELFITANSKQEVDDTFLAWGNKRITFIQKPVSLDFGYTFTALDPDGHRLRVCFLS